MICYCWECYCILIDMYMVDGFKVVLEFCDEVVFMVVLEIVQVVKFVEIIQEVFDLELLCFVDFQGIEVLLQCVEVMDFDVNVVKVFIQMYC